MLLTLSQWLLAHNPEWGFLRVFQYLTFRAVMSAMTALLIGLGLGPWVIRRLTALIEPAVIIIVGSIVGYVYLSFFMALFAATGPGNNIR